MTKPTTLEVAVSIFEDIKVNSTRTAKEAILRLNKDNVEFRKLLEFLYNPYKITGLKTKKMVKFASFKSEDVKQFADVFEAITYILENNTGKEDDVKAIMNFINQHDNIHSPVHDFLQDLFSKSYKCGITASTINKVYGKNTIPKFDLMLAEKYVDFMDKVTGEFSLTEKLDGVRCIVRKEGGIVQFFTRKGHPILGLELLLPEFNKLKDNYIYDGELLIDKDLPSKELRKLTSGLVRKEDVSNKDLIFHMFDLLPVEEFDNGKSSKTYEKRMVEKSELFKEHNSLSRIKDVNILYTGKDLSVIEPMLKEMKENGKEGLMLNKNNAFYVTKRNANLLKVKVFKEADLRIVDYKEGQGKYVGMLGSFIVEYKGNTVEVGSGYSDQQRQEFWDNRDDFIFKIVTVQYHDESTNEKGTFSLEFPVFVEIRYDKEEPSLF